MYWELIVRGSCLQLVLNCFGPPLSPKCRMWYKRGRRGKEGGGEWEGRRWLGKKRRLKGGRERERVGL